MIHSQTELRFSDHASLYDILIPADSKFRQLNNLIDFNLIRTALLKNYSKDMGRGAVDPIVLFKYLLLKTIYPASDRDLVARSYTDMSYKFFLGLNPEDDVIDPSLLTVFRRQRMKDIYLMDLLLRSTIEKAKALELISSKKVMVDATHTVAVFHSYSPVEAISKRSHLLLKALHESGIDKSTIDKLPSEPLAKKDRTSASMVAYAEQLLAAIPELDLLVTENIELKMNYLQEALDDIAERAMVCRDKDARKGHKAANKPFNGYKVHIAETTDGFITAVNVTSGEKADGGELQELIDKSEKNGLEKIEEVIADAAYGSKENIQKCDSKDIKLVAPPHQAIAGFRSEDDGFVFNKDAQAVTCPAGELSMKRQFRKASEKRKENAFFTYYFDVEKCKQCPLREGCYKEGAKYKTYMIRVLSEEHQKQKDFSETPEFKREMRYRHRIEGKNSELKNRHGLGKTISFGMESLEIQTAVAVYYVNLKRIMTLMAK